MREFGHAQDVNSSGTRKRACGGRGEGEGRGPSGWPERALGGAASEGRGCGRGAGLRARGRVPNGMGARSCLKRSLCGALAGLKEGR